MSETKMPPETPAIAVVVFREDQPLFLLDASGGVCAPDAPDLRAAAAVLLAQAALALAGLPPAEPRPLGERVIRIVETLATIDTPEAEAAIAALGEAADVQTAALEMATTALTASAPTAH